MKSSNRMLVAAGFCMAGLLTVGTSVSWAVLGETESQLAVRFGGNGEVVPDAKGDFAPAEKVLAWKKPAYVVFVCLIDGKSARELYQLARPITDRYDQTVSEVRDANSDDLTWNPMEASTVAAFNDRQKKLLNPIRRIKWMWIEPINQRRLCVEEGSPYFEVYSKDWNDLIDELSKRPARAAQSMPQLGQASSGPVSENDAGVASPDELVFADEEWRGVVAGLNKRGLVRTPEESTAYFQVFAMLKSVFVAKEIRSPSADQLFGLAKILNIPFGEMPPERIETTLRAMLNGAKEAGMEVASREALLNLGK